MVQAQVGHNAVKPGVERALEAEVPDVSIGLQEGLLVDILGVLLGTGQVQGQPQDRLVVLPDQ
jgi:hypothetical protein